MPDLFGRAAPSPAVHRVRGPPPLELLAARALCRRMKRSSTRRDKKRIAHLICANLIALVKARSKRPG